MTAGLDLRAVSDREAGDGPDEGRAGRTPRSSAADPPRSVTPGRGGGGQSAGRDRYEQVALFATTLSIMTAMIGFSTALSIGPLPGDNPVTAGRADALAAGPGSLPSPRRQR